MRKQTIRTFKRENPFELITIKTATKKSLIEILKDFVDYPSAYHDDSDFSVLYKNGKLQFFSKKNVNSVHKIRYSQIKDICFYNGNDYTVYKNFCIRAEGTVIPWYKEDINEAWFEIDENFKPIATQPEKNVINERLLRPIKIHTKEEVNQDHKINDMSAEDCFPTKFVRESTAKEVEEKVNWYLTKGRFLEQEDRNMFINLLITQLDQNKKELPQEKFYVYRKELQEIQEGKGMVEYYDRGDKKFISNTQARICLQTFADQFVEESFLEEFDYMAATCSFAEMYQWISANYNIDILQFKKGDEMDHEVDTY